MQPTPVALLHRWYCHVREKRAPRQDFLKALVKFFQENASLESAQDDVNFSRYMAENFATFEYKTLEEVLTVIKYLTNILSTTGMQILEIVSPSHLLTHLHTRQDLVHLTFLSGTDVQIILEREARTIGRRWIQYACFDAYLGCDRDRNAAQGTFESVVLAF
jgi:hypothetical protein